MINFISMIVFIITLFLLSNVSSLYLHLIITKNACLASLLLSKKYKVLNILNIGLIMLHKKMDNKQKAILRFLTFPIEIQDEIISDFNQSAGCKLMHYDIAPLELDNNVNLKEFAIFLESMVSSNCDEMFF